MEVVTGKAQEDNEFLPEDFVSDEDIAYRIEQIISDIQEDKASNVPLKLYKYDNSQWEQIGQTSADNVPSNHDIGIEHGAGKYKLLFSWKSPRAPRGRVNRKVEFVLGDYYNTLKVQNHQKKLTSQGFPSLPILAQATSNNTSNNNDMIMMMMNQMREESQRLHALMIELIRGGSKNNSGDKFQELYITELTKRSNFMMEQNSFAFKEGLKMGQEATNKEAESSEMMKIIEVISENAPIILNAFVPKSTVKQQIASYPGSKEIMENPAKVNQVFKGVAQRIGEQQAIGIAEKADISISGLNTNTPIKLKVV